MLNKDFNNNNNNNNNNKKIMQEGISQDRESWNFHYVKSL